MSAPPLRRLGLLLLLFFALTMPLAWAWLAWGQDRYVELLFAILDPLYERLGLRHHRGGPVAPRLVSVVPFVVLMLITPGMSARRRAKGVLVGLVLIAVFHLGFFVLVDSAYAVLGRSRRALTKIVPFLLVNDGLPFLIWIFFARDFLRELVPALAEPRRGGPPPGAGGAAS
jgi:hypothetical protein